MNKEYEPPYAITVQLPSRGIKVFRFWEESDAQHCMNAARQLGYLILDATCDQQLLPPILTEKEYQMHLDAVADYNGGGVSFS